MKKQIYQSPRSCAYNLMGNVMISTSMKVGNSEEKVSNGDDIGFAKEHNSQSDKDLWNEEW